MPRLTKLGNGILLPLLLTSVWLLVIVAVAPVLTPLSMILCCCTISTTCGGAATTPFATFVANLSILLAVAFAAIKLLTDFGLLLQLLLVVLIDTKPSVLRIKLLLLLLPVAVF